MLVKADKLLDRVGLLGLVNEPSPPLGRLLRRPRSPVMRLPLLREVARFSMPVCREIRCLWKCH
jgi:hypothetical protein